jgi:hypothetical protein
MHLLDRHHLLPGGDRIRLRLPHVGDRAQVHEFLTRLGLTAHDLDVRRGLRWSADRRWTVIATRWDGACEGIVGIAAVDAEDGSPTLLAEDPAVCDILSRALAEHAGTGAPRRRVA